MASLLSGHKKGRLFTFFGSGTFFVRLYSSSTQNRRMFIAYNMHFFHKIRKSKNNSEMSKLHSTTKFYVLVELESILSLRLQPICTECIPFLNLVCSDDNARIFSYLSVTMLTT